MKPVEKVISEHEKEIMSMDNVTGIYHGKRDDGKSFIGIGVEKVTPDIKKSVPNKLDGYDVQIEETGDITAQDSDLSSE
jgi:hypothetical protein